MRFIFTALILTFATQAAAGFLVDRNDWNRMSLSSQNFYAMGNFDQIIVDITNDAKRVKKMKDKIEKCALEMNLQSTDLVDIVNAHYQDLENWQHPPNVALLLGLGKVCKLWVG